MGGKPWPWETPPCKGGQSPRALSAMDSSGLCGWGLGRGHPGGGLLGTPPVGTRGLCPLLSEGGVHSQCRDLNPGSLPRMEPRGDRFMLPWRAPPSSRHSLWPCLLIFYARGSSAKCWPSVSVSCLCVGFLWPIKQRTPSVAAETAGGTERGLPGQRQVWAAELSRGCRGICPGPSASTAGVLALALHRPCRQPSILRGPHLLWHIRPPPPLRTAVAAARAHPDPLGSCRATPRSLVPLKGTLLGPVGGPLVVFCAV